MAQGKNEELFREKLASKVDRLVLEETLPKITPNGDLRVF